MTRFGSDTSAMQTILRAAVVRPLYLVELEFNDGVIYLSSSTGDYSWNGHTWLGSGLLVQIAAIQENTEQRANNFSVTLAAEGSDIVAAVLGQCSHKNYANFYMGFLDESYALMTSPAPYKFFSGFFDTTSLKENGESTEATIVYENELIRQKKIIEYRYTNNCQQALHPGDTGLLYAASASDWQGFWGKAERVKYIRKRKLSK